MSGDYGAFRLGLIQKILADSLTPTDVARILRKYAPKIGSPIEAEMIDEARRYENSGTWK